MSQGSKRLIDDHLGLHGLLKQVQSALEHGDVHGSYAKLDLFWAKLAVHIRAEHLHLFPALLDSTRVDGFESETKSVIERLREDHNYFMHQLAGAVAKLRGLLNGVEEETINSQLNEVGQTIFEVEQRLEGHNQLEETQAYGWVESLLSAEKQDELAELISYELEKCPARFNATTWWLGRLSACE